MVGHSYKVKPCEGVCRETLCEVKIACFCNKILSYSPLTHTLGFSRGEVRDNLTHCVHLKGELELLLGFDSLLSTWRCIVYVCLCYVIVLFVSGGWYSSYSDTQSLFTRQDALEVYLEGNGPYHVKEKTNYIERERKYPL